jgi:hypothetical protein
MMNLAMSSAGVAGVLRVHPTNPRYFTDDGIRAVYLTGSHTWDNFQDLGEEAASQFDFKDFLDLLEKHSHNFTRLWVWEQAAWAPWSSAKIVFDPMPYERSGPGTALDGKPKFNLERFNQVYFDRLRARVIAAQERGIYVAVMLFNGWSIGKKTGQSGNPWPGHPFHRDNNINGIDGDADGDGEGQEIHTRKLPAISVLQEIYVRKVIDMVNDLDNVIYEIANESHDASLAWQEYLVDYIRAYEGGKPKQHPVLVTSPYAYLAINPGQLNALLSQSNAEAISPNDAGGYFNNPPANDGSKIIFNDTDHLCGVCGDASWVWKSFTRGLNPIFMDPMDDFRWEPARLAMGQTLRLARNVNLAEMEGRPDLCSTSYCLANPGREYIAYVPPQPHAVESIIGRMSSRIRPRLRRLLRTRNIFHRAIEIDLSDAYGVFKVACRTPRGGTLLSHTTTTGGGRRLLHAPFNGDVVVHLSQQ